MAIQFYAVLCLSAQRKGMVITMTELQNENTPKKGPFWLICGIDSNGNIAAEKLITYSVFQTQVTPSHKDVWEDCKGSIKKPWNYYPRGRVEIRNSKAVVYANPLCFEYAGLISELRVAYHLGNLTMSLKADNSTHYTKGVLGEYGRR